MATKISQVQPNGTLTLQSGEFHKFNITLEDGRSGEVLAKTPERWKVGDEVDAELQQTQYGNKLKLKKPEFAGQGGGSYSAPRSTGGGMTPDKERRITFLSCLSSAASFYAQSSKTPEEVIATALQFTNAAFSLEDAEAKAKTPEQPPF